ncbi:hypothetical protein [Niastella populi]|uniref:DUF1574 domain-containing protein n=1 Tax=Niastella populi TaxID=550983 RepID=A0A1V9GBA3_9BACT|nr:hypothetical protein [Niastella populi]OQP67837.1 hypothetical protein A4R26_32645 [Niastella populi]
MRKLISKFFLFLIAITLLIAALLYFSNRIINDGNYFSLKSNSKYVVFGHSHPAYAFNDSLIENFVNYAQQGECYFYTYFKVKKILENNKRIETVFIDFSNNQIDKRMDDWIWSDRFLDENCPDYMPFLGFEDLKILIRNNWRGLLELQNISLRSNVSFFYGNEMNYFKSKNAIGYLYSDRQKADSLIKTIPVQKSNIKADTGISEINIHYLEKILDLCTANKVKVYLIRTPIHSRSGELLNEDKFQQILSSRFKTIEFLDFKRFPLADAEFGDLEHLNYKGAEKFSLFFNLLMKENVLAQSEKQKFIDKEMVKE